MTAKNTGSYQRILKSTSILGGVQVVNIIIAILRSKFIAIFLGPTGMGIVALFTNTLGLITGMTNFGLGTSAVKNVAFAAGSGDNIKLAKTISVFRVLVWITGGIGFLLTLLLAPWLSELAFDNKEYALSFAFLSITLLFTQINAGQNVILQGMRKIQYLAKANLFGSIAGLLISLPLYYFIGVEGIVPAIIATSFVALLLSWLYANKIKVQKIRIDPVVFRTEGREMLKMGFLISFSSIFALGAAYILRIYISRNGGIQDVGLFTAGFAIIATYVGMVFKAMGTDYYPRLASMNNDNIKCSREVNQQAEIAILILAPILITLLVFIEAGVIVLYSEEFLGVVDMIQWAALGIFFQAMSWSLGYVLLAKGASRVFFWNELISNSYLLGLNILGYYLFGLKGLGISFLVAYFLHLIQMMIVTRKLYGIKLDRDCLLIFIVQFIIAIFSFFINFYVTGVAAYVAGCILIIASLLYSWKELNKRIGIGEMIRTRLKK